MEMCTSHSLEPNLILVRFMGSTVVAKQPLFDFSMLVSKPLKCRLLLVTVGCCWLLLLTITVVDGDSPLWTLHHLITTSVSRAALVQLAHL